MRTCQLRVCGPRLKQLSVVVSALTSPQANKLNTSLLNPSIKVDLSRETSLNPMPPSPLQPHLTLAPSPFSSFHTCDASVASLHPLCHPGILFIGPTACHRQRTPLPCFLALASQPQCCTLVPSKHTHTHTYSKVDMSASDTGQRQGAGRRPCPLVPYRPHKRTITCAYTHTDMHMGPKPAVLPNVNVILRATPSVLSHARCCQRTYL